MSKSDLREVSSMHCKFSTPMKICLQPNSNSAAGNGCGKRGWVEMALSPEFNSYYPRNRKPRTGTMKSEAGNTEVGSTGATGTEATGTEARNTEARSWKRQARSQKREERSQFKLNQLCNTNTTLCPNCLFRPADCVAASSFPLLAKGFKPFCARFSLPLPAAESELRFSLCT